MMVALEVVLVVDRSFSPTFGLGPEPGKIHTIKVSARAYVYRYA